MTGHSASFLFATKNLMPLLCAESRLLSAPAPLGDRVYELSPGHEGCTLRLLLAEATVQPRTSPCPAVQGALPLTFSLRGLGGLVAQSIRRAATRGTVGVCWCLKAEPRGSDACAEGTAAQEQGETDSRPPGGVLSTRKRLLPSRSAKVQREGGPYMGVPESQCSISPAAWALE